MENIVSPILKVINVSKRFSNKIIALNKINFNVYEGDFVLIAGSNGSGKTVLMNLIANLDKPSEGRIEVNGNAGLVFQDADCQILGETPYEDVAFGVKNLGFKKNDVIQKTENALKECGIFHKRDYPARNMSGGEKRRLAVAGILAMERDLIIFDEPFANLDYPGVQNVCKILKDLKDKRKTVLILTHETEKILGLCNRMIVLDKGELRFDGTPEDALKENLEQWSIRNPLSTNEGLLWL
ncbi:MAG: ABC transporter ATP-binding protein [Treponema sp.]|nr:ABC transporter ATP-binding protein [Treponema sp.]